MARVWHAIAAVILVAAVAGVVSVARRPNVHLVEVRFPGSYEATGTIAVEHPGLHAIWAGGEPAADATRCAISAPPGKAVSVTTAGRHVEWVNRGEDDAVYTWIASFDAPTAGTYTIRCRPDPNAPGAAYLVSEGVG